MPTQLIYNKLNVCDYIFFISFRLPFILRRQSVWETVSAAAWRHNWTHLNEHYWRWRSSTLCFACSAGFKSTLNRWGTIECYLRSPVLSLLDCYSRDIRKAELIQYHLLHSRIFDQKLQMTQPVSLHRSQRSTFRTFFEMRITWTNLRLHLLSYIPVQNIVHHWDLVFQTTHSISIQLLRLVHPTALRLKLQIVCCSVNLDEYEEAELHKKYGS